MIAIIVVAIVIGAIAIFWRGDHFSIGAICCSRLICLLVPVAIAVNVIIEQATIAIVVENLGVMDGLHRGWEVVKSNVVRWW